MILSADVPAYRLQDMCQPGISSGVRCANQILRKVANHAQSSNASNERAMNHHTLHEGSHLCVVESGRRPDFERFARDDVVVEVSSKLLRYILDCSIIYMIFRRASKSLSTSDRSDCGINCHILIQCNSSRQYDNPSKTVEGKYGSQKTLVPALEQHMQCEI